MERMEVEDGELARARSGDQEAFRALVDRHGRALFALAFRLTGNSHDAEDVVQETFVKAWRRLDEFEARSQFSSWLHRIAANTAYDLLRSRRRRPEDPLVDGEVERPVASATPSADRLVFGREVDARIRAALHRLGPMERSAFLLRHVDGLSLREIAQAMGSEPNAVKQSVCRAVKKMREALRPALAGGFR